MEHYGSEPKVSTAPCASRTMEQLEKAGYLNEEFRLFHLRDRQDREFPYHYHDFHKIIVFLSGKVTYHIEGKSYHLKPWDILLVSRHAIHRPEIDAAVPYERFILYVKEELTQSLLTQCFQKAADRSFSLVRLNPELQAHLKDILYELEVSLHTEAFGSEILCTSLFHQFMIYLNRIFLEKEYIHDRKSYSSDSQIDKLLTYINRNLEADLSVETLARKYYLSKYYLMRKFKEETGYTLHSYIVSKRLLLARALITDGTPVIKAARQSGFHDYTTFVRAYKKQFGATPSKG